MSEFKILDVTYGGVVISVRLRWLFLPGLGALRVADRAVWEGARQCASCRTLGYDHGDIDAFLEAQRLRIEHAPCIVPCASCDAPTCDACADATGTMCRSCYAEGAGRVNPQAEYARLASLVVLHLDELRQALERHEESGRWHEHEFLERVEAGLAELVTEVPRS